MSERTRSAILATHDNEFRRPQHNDNRHIHASFALLTAYNTPHLPPHTITCPPPTSGMEGEGLPLGYTHRQKVSWVPVVPRNDVEAE
jgi:hypothetical protein